MGRLESGKKGRLWARSGWRLLAGEAITELTRIGRSLAFFMVLVWFLPVGVKLEVGIKFKKLSVIDQVLAI
jgi:hypothetical protein